MPPAMAVASVRLTVRKTPSSMLGLRTSGTVSGRLERAQPSGVDERERRTHDSWTSLAMRGWCAFGYSSSLASEEDVRCLTA